MKILSYVRPWNYDQFRFLVDAIDDNSHAIFCSEHPSVDFMGLSSLYYSELKKGGYKSDLCELCLIDIVKRCRLLRTLTKKNALRHIYAMEYALNVILEREKPKVVLSLTVDSYVVDLLRICCEKKNILFIGIVPTFVNGFFRVTARGEANINHFCEIVDIEKIKSNLLTPSYSPSFNSSSLKNPRRSVFMRWINNIIRPPFFLMKRYLFGDPYNYHYWSSQKVSYGLINILPPNDQSCLDWIDRIGKDPRPRLYIPLQMFPEATVDYWCEDVSVIDYYESLEVFIARNHEQFNLLVKEHPSVMGSRPNGFYRRLGRDSRITIIPTYVPSNNVLDHSDGVVIWTGSVGFEAALRGKAVVSMATPYYAYGPRFKKIVPEVDSSVVLSHVKWSKDNIITKDEQDELIEHLVKQLFKGNFKNNGTWSRNCTKDIDDCKMMATSLRSYIENSLKNSSAYES